MKTSKLAPLLVSALVLAAGVAGTFFSRQAAIAEGAAAAAKMQLSLFLILTVSGAAFFAVQFLPERKPANVRTMVFAAMFAALCYVGFTYLKIDIPVGSSSTAFHLGNVFVVLGALILGGYWGGLAGAVGLTIADLTTQYVTSAPKTFLLKLCIGLIAGSVAQYVFHLNQDRSRKMPLSAAAALSCAAGLGFNVIADPIVGCFYKQYVLGVPQDAAKTLAKIGAITTLVNAVVAVVVSTILYLALRGPLKRSGMLDKV